MPQFIDGQNSLFIHLTPLQCPLHIGNFVCPVKLVVHFLLKVALHEHRDTHLIDYHQDVLEVLVNEGQLV